MWGARRGGLAVRRFLHLMLICCGADTSPEFMWVWPFYSIACSFIADEHGGTNIIPWRGGGTGRALRMDTFYSGL